ncbi:MAG: tRNA (adenosine(37)-N6)-threonylcarbamoyltransferase complex dimerization subunit type 1 TsaB [Chthoniobacterales bacterium]|nr:tRNA (adenosine(37)-N6)-threonylcarbamoyltransferase complex dimerization subunit type 1 TsaB [Chthoniobacterales bacterium]
MKILALELSSSRGSIAFRDDAPESSVFEFANDRKHSGAFFDTLKICTARCGMPERIVVGLGPGSYAGTRIAIAAAIGLQSAIRAELIGLASARAFPLDSREYAVVGDARRHSFYYARVRDRRCVEGPLLCSERELQARLAASEIPAFSTGPLQQFSSVTTAFPSALLLAEIGVTEEPTSSDVPLEPIYLREPHITQQKSSFSGTRR